MKILSFISFIVRSASYGIVIAVLLLFFLPQLRSNTSLASYNIFDADAVSDKPISYVKAVNRAAPAVVNIYSESFSTSPRYGSAPSTHLKLGSGVIMDERGYILTADHVISNADHIFAQLQSGERLEATIVGRDPITDLAVLQVNAPNLPVIPRNDDITPFVGDIVLAIGNPHNLGQTITQGIVSAVGRSGLSNTNYREFLQTDAAINPGNSGGALVNSNGELVGINSASFNRLSRTRDIQGIFFAVPYRLASKIMNQLIENGRVIRGYLGIESMPKTTNDRGFYIDNVTPGSPASKAGLKINDFVYQINDVAISSVSQALDMIAETPPNVVLQFHLIRKDKQIVVPVTIGELVTN